MRAEVMTSLANLEEMIQKGESETCEFKKSTALLSGIGETLCGFLNGKGGKVLIGVSAEGKVVGQNVSDNTFREIAELIKKFEPPPIIEISRIEVQYNKEIILLTASPRQCDIPYVFQGRPYQRIGSTTSRMPQLVYQRLLLERNHTIHRWETEMAVDYNLDDLDAEEIRRTIRMGTEAGRLPEYRGEDISSILDRLGLRKTGRLLNAAIVLFGKKFLPEFTQCQLRLARFKGIDKTEFIDQNQLYGNAFCLLEEAMLFLRRHLPIAGKILPGVLERTDEPLFPLVALREALVNAFCHRTYTSPGGAVSVAIFDNRLEIWNDGNLLFGLTPADLKKDHTSHQRNPVIANTFYSRGLIEKWGRGTQKIVSLCVKAGHPEPEFFEQSTSFVVRFLPSAYIAPHRISHDLTDRQRQILQSLSISLDKGTTFTEIKFKISNPPANRTLRDDFQHLKRLGLIDVSGHGRGAKWYLIASGENKAE
jgi:ATP-dependent DNA helicase RecG